MTHKYLSIVGYFLVTLSTVYCLQYYPGNNFLYLFFSISFNTLFFIGFRKNKIFFDTFIGSFLWLGFWIKFSIRQIFLNGKFNESVGQFNYFPSEYDNAMLVSSIGALALILASFIREKLLFKYPSNHINKNSSLFFEYYKRNRTIILTLFIVFFLIIASINYFAGIYQKGSQPETILPYSLNGLFKWLLLFGLTSFSCVLLDFERLIKKSGSLLFLIALFENFFSSVSLLSRGMILNASALFWGKLEQLSSTKAKFRFLIPFTVILIFLFGCSIFLTNNLRGLKFKDQITEDSLSERIQTFSKRTKVLIIDRWVGIEGVMAISSYNKKSWHLFNMALDEKSKTTGTSFYDLSIINSPYIEQDLSTKNFISIPGFIGFFYYPGSLPFLFIIILLIGIFSALIEFSCFKVSSGNLFFCSLIGQVIAYRWTHFGYSPKQSYLLFGSIFLNIFLIWVAYQPSIKLRMLLSIEFWKKLIRFHS